MNWIFQKCISYEYVSITVQIRLHFNKSIMYYLIIGWNYAHQYICNTPWCTLWLCACRMWFYPLWSVIGNYCDNKLRNTAIAERRVFYFLTACTNVSLRNYYVRKSPKGKVITWYLKRSLSRGVATLVQIGHRLRILWYLCLGELEVSLITFQHIIMIILHVLGVSLEMIVSRFL